MYLSTDVGSTSSTRLLSCCHLGNRRPTTNAEPRRCTHWSKSWTTVSWQHPRHRELALGWNKEAVNEDSHSICPYLKLLSTNFSAAHKPSCQSRQEVIWFLQQGGGSSFAVFGTCLLPSELQIHWAQGIPAVHSRQIHRYPTIKAKTAIPPPEMGYPSHNTNSNILTSES